MPNQRVSELREESRRLREAARQEPNVDKKQRLAERALELAQEAERLERGG